MDVLSKIARERKWKYFEIRGGASFEAPAEGVTAFYGHKLALRGGAQELFQRFTNATKRAIRQALKSDLAVEIAQGPEAMREFYHLHMLTRRRHGLPPQPMAFFAGIQENVIKPGLGFVVLIRKGLRAIAAAVFFTFQGKSVYKFAASDPKFQKCRGNNLVIWEAIKYLVGEGSEVLDFGRTSLDNDGLRRFKLSWGTEEETITYFRFDTRTGAWMTPLPRPRSWHHKFFRNLPLAANRLAGSMIYPHLD